VSLILPDGEATGDILVKSISFGTAMGISLLVSLFLLLGGMALAYFYVTLTRDLPSLEIFSLYLDPPRWITYSANSFV
jgi:hypothetical protein